MLLQGGLWDGCVRVVCAQCGSGVLPPFVIGVERPPTDTVGRWHAVILRLGRNSHHQVPSFKTCLHRVQKRNTHSRSLLYLLGKC